jgi:hypothetical protein
MNDIPVSPVFNGHPVAAFMFGDHTTMLRETVAFISLGSAYESVLESVLDWHKAEAANTLGDAQNFQDNFMAKRSRIAVVGSANIDLTVFEAELTGQGWTDEGWHCRE